MPPVGLCVQLACVWEATARKPGNVHPDASFPDLTYDDFIVSANVVAPVLANVRELERVGLESLRGLAERHDCIGDVRAIGGFQAIELMPDGVLRGASDHRKDGEVVGW